MEYITKRPELAKAIKWDGYLVDPVLNLVSHKVVSISHSPGEKLIIQTTSDFLEVPVGHYVVAALDGEVYSVAPDKFQDKYERY